MSRKIHRSLALGARLVDLVAAIATTLALLITSAAPVRATVLLTHPDRELDERWIKLKNEWIKHAGLARRGAPGL